MTARAGTRSGRVAGIFISYRRDDTAGFAGRLYDRLAERFGAGSVFMDIDTIRPGHEFAVDIEQALSECAACIVLIGRRWTTIEAADGTRRLDDPTDFVRLEVAAAIRRGVPVFPVLVENAAPPTAASLPPEIQGVAARQAIELSNERWNYDVGRLLLALDEALGRAPDRAKPRGGAKPQGRSEGSRRGWTLGIVAGIAILVVVGVAGWLATRPSADEGGGTPSADGTAAAWCDGGAPLCGTFDVALTLPEFDERGFSFEVNDLWGKKDPFSGYEWPPQEWIFGSPRPKDWRITSMPARDGELEDGVYVDEGGATCADGSSTGVTRRFTVLRPPTSPSDGFEGKLEIVWQCPSQPPFSALILVEGRATG
jgi:hypothetical protein